MPRKLADSWSEQSLPAFCSRIALGMRSAFSSDWRGCFGLPFPEDDLFFRFGILLLAGTPALMRMQDLSRPNDIPPKYKQRNNNSFWHCPKRM
jgi:hypothetical protein